MFEVEPNLWLQSFASPWLTWLMLAITTLGYEWFYIAVIVVLGFGVRLRPTLGVMLALLLAGLATHAAKDGFGLPRPDEVDARVLHEASERTALVEHGGATGWLALPSPDALAAARARPQPDFGFISGHVAAATAMCLGLLLCFRIRRRALVLGLCAWPLLMAVSRMYLGRHFLGDVLGGLCAGALAAGLAAWLLSARRRPGLVVLAAATVALCVLAPFIPLLEQSTLGRLLGLVVVIGVLEWRGFPPDGGGPWQRAARIACLCGLYLLVRLAVEALGSAAGWTRGDLVWLPVTALATAGMFLVGVAIAGRLGLFRDEAAAET